MNQRGRIVVSIAGCFYSALGVEAVGNALTALVKGVTYEGVMNDFIIAGATFGLAMFFILMVFVAND